jgi:hypothetical protein
LAVLSATPKQIGRKEEPVDRLSDLLAHAVQFSYTALDRIVLNGYIDVHSAS